MNSDEVFDVVTKLSDGMKYKLLTNHQKPEVFPKTFQDGCNRRFKEEYYKDRSWLAYSSHLDAAFCVPCVLFARGTDRGSLQALVNVPFRRWSRISVIKEHAGKNYHKNAMVASKSFRATIDRPETQIANQLDNKRLRNIDRNRKMLTHIINAIVYLTKQGLALRGDKESTESKNKGNFLELIELLGKYEPELADHLKLHKRSSYVSPMSQNEFISVIGHECIRSSLVNEIIEANLFSIICDEASSGKQEFLSIIVRFLDKNNTIREEFLGFHPVLKCTGQILAEQIVEKLASLGIDIANCRGQGYDGAAAMSSDRCGVQAVIKEKAPVAAYVHCASHCLNLVIVHSCKLTAVGTMMEKISMVSLLCKTICML
jgi:hypothetical protein